MITILALILLSGIISITPDNIDQLQVLHQIESGDNFATVLAFHPQNDLYLYAGHKNGAITFYDLSNNIS